MYSVIEVLVYLYYTFWLIEELDRLGWHCCRGGVIAPDLAAEHFRLVIECTCLYLTLFANSLMVRYAWNGVLVLETVFWKNS